MKLVKLPDGGEIIERRNGNGANKLIWWMLSIATSIVVMGVGWWMTSMSSAMAGMQSVSSMRGERLSILEANAVSTKENYVTLILRVGKMDDKLDILLRRK